jgi:hypothetical protein
MLQSGKIYYIMCLGPSGGNRWLNGETANQAVDLAPDPTDPNTGSAWKATELEPGIWQFQCQGFLDPNQYLNGHTREGTVNLNYDKAATGTRWAIENFDGIYNCIKCLGDVEGYRWLNGETGGRDWSVNLKENHGDDYSGTRWRFYQLVS